MRKTRHILFLALVAFALAACTQDEWTEQGTALPEGEYPLQIGGISITAESSEQPWTRVAEDADGMGSHWMDGDRIGVRIGDNKEETGIYIINVDDAENVTVTPETPVYWKNTQSATVTAWYPVDNEIDFTNQDQGLTYLLKGTSNANASYNTPVSLTFEHQLAKVRVKLDGARANAVSAVTVLSHVSTGNDEGSRGTDSQAVQYVPMLQTTDNGQTCWEATLLPGTLVADNSFRLTPAGGGDPVQAVLDNAISIAAGNVYNITITTKPYPDGAQQITGSTGDISDNGDYYVTGNLNTSINITGGKPNIYLYEATVSANSGSAINIQDGNPTIHAVGNSSLNAYNSDFVQGGAGIFVAEGSSVIIKSADKNTNSLTVTGYQGAGIGGVAANMDATGTPCGNITIENVTITATTNAIYGYPPGIGSCGTATCGTITITNAIVHATGRSTLNAAAPAIGAGFNADNEAGAVPTIQITDSDIYAHKGNYSDYIGLPGQRIGYNGGAIQFGTGGYCRNSTVYCYTGSGDTLDKTVVYDGSGVGTEQQ